MRILIDEKRYLFKIKNQFNLKKKKYFKNDFSNGSLDILIADTSILDYYRATDNGCKLRKIGDILNEDSYAIGMTKGFALKVRINPTYVVLSRILCQFFNGLAILLNA